MVNDQEVYKRGTGAAEKRAEPCQRKYVRYVTEHLEVAVELTFSAGASTPRQATGRNDGRRLIWSNRFATGDFMTNTMPQRSPGSFG